MEIKIESIGITKNYLELGGELNGEKMSIKIDLSVVKEFIKAFWYIFVS